MTDRQMIAVFIFSLCMTSLGWCDGAPQLTCPSQTVSAEEGGRVKISVFMDPPTDITDDRVNFKRADQEDVYVHIYSPNGYRNKLLQAAEYKNRTSVSEEDLIRGVLDLEIRKLSLKDSGSYRVSSSKYRTACTFNISVVSSGAPQLTCPSQTVSAKEGKSIKISVFMDPQSDMRGDTMTIKRADNKDVIVHIQDSNPSHNENLQAAEYKNRTSVREEDLIRGVLDLEIRNLSLKDSGSYRVSSYIKRIDCTFSISVVSSGAPQLTCPSQTVSAEEGRRVKISVFMDPQSDMTDDLVFIERADHEDEILHIYDHNGHYNKLLQAAEYKNRTSVSEEDLIRGVLDLEIRNLSLKDSGSYRVSSSKYRTECTFNISVGHSQTETLKTVLLVSVVLLIIIVAVVVYLCRSGWIRKVWPRVRGRVCLLFGGSQGPDPDPEVKFKPVQSEDGEFQVALSST